MVHTHARAQTNAHRHTDRHTQAQTRTKTQTRTQTQTQTLPGSSLVPEALCPTNVAVFSHAYATPLSQ